MGSLNPTRKGDSPQWDSLEELLGVQGLVGATFGFLSPNPIGIEAVEAVRVGILRGTKGLGLG
jgi:hypothetical protein